MKSYQHWEVGGGGDHTKGIGNILRWLLSHSTLRFALKIGLISWNEFSILMETLTQKCEHQHKITTSLGQSISSQTFAVLIPYSHSIDLKKHSFNRLVSTSLISCPNCSTLKFLLIRLLNWPMQIIISTSVTDKKFYIKNYLTFSPVFIISLNIFARHLHRHWIETPYQFITIFSFIGGNQIIRNIFSTNGLELADPPTFYLPWPGLQPIPSPGKVLLQPAIHITLSQPDPQVSAITYFSSYLLHLDIVRVGITCHLQLHILKTI